MFFFVSENFCLVGILVNDVIHWTGGCHFIILLSVIVSRFLHISGKFAAK